MALMVIGALLTGAVVVMVVFKITRWWELFVLGGWGIVATVVIMNGDFARFWNTVANWIG